jgi:hypothetical protein
MSKTTKTAGEIADSLTGHEEMWISDQFGKSIGELIAAFITKNDASPYYRALIFIMKRREQINDDDARNQVMDMPAAEVLTYFAEESEESGKDESASETPSETSLTGVPELAAVPMSS